MRHPADIIQQIPFQPGLLVRSARLQTILASTRRRVPASLALVDNETEHRITTPKGVALQYFHSQQDTIPCKTVILIHGWEGSVRSAYILSTGETLYQTGYDIIRLHLRDHGDTHALNEKPFRSDRIVEVADAVRMICDRVSPAPVALAGFSLGGNFAVRVAREFGTDAPVNFNHAVCICPLLDPIRSTRIIDDIAWLRRYFMQKWFRGLKKKAAAFPDIYDFSEVYRMKNCWEMTEALIRRYSNYPRVEDYFDRYTITGERLSGITVPTTIVTAADDPVIPVSDFHRLKLSDSTRLHIAAHGGHCGFIENWKLESWVNRVMPSLMAAALTGSASG